MIENNFLNIINLKGHNMNRTTTHKNNHKERAITMKVEKLMAFI